MASRILEYDAAILNQFLINKYEISLHEFALAVCCVLNIPSYKGKPTHSELVDKRRDYKNMIRLMKRIYGPEPLDRDVFEADLNILEIDIIETPSKRGRAIDLKSIIISLWGLLFSQKNKKIEWNIVRDLYDWFWLLLSPYSFYKELEPSSDPDNLKKQYHRNKGRFEFPYPYNNLSYNKNFSLIIFAKTFVSLDTKFTLFFILMNKWIEENNLGEYKRICDILEGKRKPLDWKDKRDAYYMFASKIFGYHLPSNILAVPLIIFPNGSYLLQGPYQPCLQKTS